MPPATPLILDTDEEEEYYSDYLPPAKEDADDEENMDFTSEDEMMAEGGTPQAEREDVTFGNHVLQFIVEEGNET
jgi:hypothetical protein